MAFDGIVTKSIVDELKNIIGSKIDKIYEPDKNTIILGLYLNGKNYGLNICIDSRNYRINLTTHSKVNPLVAPNFCMLLRKHLLGGRISDVTMIGLERLVNIQIETINEFNEIEIKTLVIELMGKHSNIILINSKEIIIDAIRHIDSTSSYREILPSRIYTLPKSEKFDFTELKGYEDFCDKISKELESNSIEKAIVNTFTGFSLVFAKSVINKCKINEISTKSLEKIYNYVYVIINKRENLSFEKIYKNDKVSDYVITTG